MKLRKLAVAALVVALGFGSQPALAQQSVADRAAIDQALAEKVRSDESARDSVRTLLGRDEVKAMAANLGLDLRRAATAVSTLQGADLERVSDRAAVANDMLAGGTQTVTVSLVAVLLIVIIIILVAD